MKKIILTNSIILLTAISLLSQPAIRVRNDAHIHLNPTRSITFGTGTATPNNGAWSIEQYWGGLNFWKAWPTYANGNFKMHLNDLGMLGVNMRAMTRTYTGSAPWPFSNSMNQWACYLWVNGRAASDGWYTYSDSSMKGSVTTLPNSLDKVLAMRPVSYVYKTRKFAGQDTIPDLLFAESDSSKQMTCREENARIKAQPEFETIQHYGFIAQELKRVCPTVVAELGPTEGINLPEIVPILVKAIQEQQQTIQDLRQEIKNWKGKTIDTTTSKTKLFQNTPNPFDGKTTISYFIDENATVNSATIEIRDIMGNLKTTVTLGDRSGLGQVDYDGSNLNQGYYIYTLKLNDSVKDSKMFLKEN